MQPIEMQQRNIFRAPLSIEHASRLHAFAQIHESSAHSRPGALVGRASHSSHQLIRFKGPQQAATQVGQKSQLAIASDQFPFALGRLQV